MPAHLSDERWRVLSPHLDRALELTAEQRAAWLAELRAEDTTLAADLEALLARDERLTELAFLEGAAAPPPLEATLAGHVVGAYTLRSLIGQGGMGSVWLAERSDGRYTGVAAVKLLNASLVGRDGESRFRREGSILARLRHPHIAHLIDAGVSPLGYPYLVLEHVDGQRIDEYCDARRLDVQARIRLFLEVLEAVAHAHANLVVHRDIKPTNVLVTSGGRVKLLDFGIAKLLERDDGTGATTALTADGQAALTPEYAAPEQVTGGAITTATDVYALGLLLYLLLTGRHPAAEGAASPAELIRVIVETEPARASDSASGDDAAAAEAAARRAATPRRLKALLRGDLDTIVGKALKKSPQERYASAEALADDLRRYLANRPVTARPDSLAYRGARFVRRNRTPVALAALLLVALAAGLAGTVTQAGRATEQARRADEQARTAGEQRDFALRQLARAEAINELNSFLLFDAAPRGKPFTAGDLLARAEAIVERQADDAAESRVELLVAIGRQYQLQEEHAKARRVLARAYDLSRRSHDPATRAAAGCAFADALATGEDTARAERLAQESLAELPLQPQFALHRVSCLLHASEVARYNGDAGRAVARADAAQALLSQSPVASEVLALRVMMDRAESYRLAGRHRESAQAFEQAFARLTAIGRGDTETAGTLLNNWANVLAGQGRPYEAERLYRRAIAISSADGTERAVSPMLLSNLGRTLADLHRLPEAAGFAERAYARARQRGDEVVVQFALLARATIYRQQGRLRRAEEALSELEPALRRSLGQGYVFHAVVASEWAEIARARGDIEAARAGADQAVALAAASTDRGFLARALRRRAELELQLNDVAKALGDASDAVRLQSLISPPGVPSQHLGLCHLTLGRVLRAQGRLAEARVAFSAAVENLAPALGEQHPETRAARELMRTTAAALPR